MPWPLLYLGLFLISCATGWFLTALALRIGKSLDLLDHPTGRKAHVHAVPVTGGWAIYLSFILIVGCGGWAAPSLASILPVSWEPLPHYLENLAGIRGDLAAILGGLSFIFFVGAIDDIRPLGPRLKLGAQILATAPLLMAGIHIHIFLPWPALGMAVTVAWAVFLMNSFNFMDNMDGLCATVAVAIAAVLAIAAVQGGELWLPALFFSFAGILAGFLVFNFHPASIFLGDSGSLVIGYLMAVFSIMTTFYGGKQPTGLPVLIPLAVMGVPLFDTASVFWIRWRKGVSLMVGDQNHFSHRLRAMGFSVRQTAVTIGLLTGAIGLSSLSLRYLELGGALLHLLALMMLFAVIGALEFVGRKGKKP